MTPLCSVFVLGAFFLILVGANAEKDNYKVEFIDLPVDHFSYAVNATFKLRYLVNDTYATDAHSPIFFYTGNEGNIELFAKNTGFIWDLAQHFKGLIVFAEHRYYGISLPFGNKSYDDPAHFGYLTAEQALADYAELLDYLTSGDYSRPVIAIGGSYGGMLAAWFRMKYPHIVAGALAASAPVFQFTGITPCDVFSRITSSVFENAYNPNCTINIKESWTLFKQLASTKKGIDTLNSKFNICNSSLLKNEDDLENFFDYLENVYGNLAMANYPYENDFLAPLPAYPVRYFCSKLAKKYNSTDLLDAMKEAINVYANFTGTTKCLNYNSAYDSDLGSKGWDVQSCTEMVMPMCSGQSAKDMFREKKWDFKKYSDECLKKYNVRPREYEIITRFGGKRLESASNIIFSNGLLDPWVGGGVLRMPNNQVNVIIIPEGAHHIDLRPANPKDPESVREARNYEKNIIGDWISKHV